MAMFDIKSLDVAKHAEAGLEVPILDPRDKSPTGITIKVLGVFAPRFKELLQQARKRDELAKKTLVGRAVSDARNDEDEIAELLAEVTIDWSGMVEAGKEVPFSKGEAERIYAKYQIIRQQVFDAALDVANFVRG